jgi:hypothetical protein
VNVLLLAAAALAVSALLGDLQLALTSAAAVAAALCAAVIDRRARRMSLHVAAGALALAALEAARPALGDAAGVAAAAVFAYTVYVAYVAYSYVWRVLKKARV